MASSMASMAAALHSTTTSIDNQQQQQSANNTTIIEPADATQEVKTEFYTREGLWSLVHNSGEYARQVWNSVQQQFQPQNQPAPTSVAGVGNQQNGSASNLNGSPVVVNVAQVPSSNTPNEPVQVKLFRFSKRLLVQDSFVPAMEYENLPKQTLKMCQNCIEPSQKSSSPRKTGYDYDDDDDVVVTKLSSNTVKFTLSDSTASPGCMKCGNGSDLVDVDEDMGYEEEQKGRLMTPHLDVLVFNYSKEIYSFEFNPVNRRSDSDSPASKNLIDKKVYKTYMSSCLDINRMASALNTKALQLLVNSSQSVVTSQPSSVIMSPVTAGMSTGLSPGSTPARASVSSSNPREILDDNFRFSVSSSNLSLIIAAGFSKGEVHVFDVFKKEASVFFNNSKLVDKTKVTCIKWVPNSVNLFLVGYSSGNMYLYDANSQAQATVAPTYAKHIQTDSYSVFLNANSSSSPESTSQSGLGNLSANTSASKSAGLGQNYPSSSMLNPGQQSKQLQLNLTNISQPIQVAKNPLVRIKIGEFPSNYQLTPDSSSDLSGINDFAFSPCGQFLAVVSQDGLLRVFCFSYDSNPGNPINIQLRCSMKSYFGGLLCVSWSHDGRYIATGGEDDLITVFAFVDGMRVACRGRGHSSWINAIAFDPWTVLPIFSPLSPDKNDTESNDLSDLEENVKKPTKQHLIEQKLDEQEQANKHNKDIKVTGPKQRTISTLSDYANINRRHTNNHQQSTDESNPSIYYRLASVGQDNQICFWDLTEDVLRERPGPVTSSSGHYRARMTSTTTTSTSVMGSPSNATLNPSVSSTASSNKQPNGTKSGHHSAASTLVSTARNIFSKHSDKNQGSTDGEDSLSSNIIKTSSLGSGIFRKNKRVSANNGASTADPSVFGSGKQKTSGNKSQIILNSYKKANTEIIATNPQGLSDSDTSSKKGISTRQLLIPPIMTDHSQFNVCPKLDEVPIVEPLICKRIANERLNSIAFRDDCFVVGTQDGFVYTWARPVKENAKSSKCVNESKITTSL